MFANVPALGEVANFGTDYFLLKIKFLAKRKREFTTKFAILPNGLLAVVFMISNGFQLFGVKISLDFGILDESIGR